MKLNTEIRERGDVWVIVPGEEDIKPLEKVLPDVSLVSVTGFSWDDDLSPWFAPKVFKKGNDFGGNAQELLDHLTGEIIPGLKQTYSVRKLIIAGYSLAGLFALYAAGSTEAFDGAVSASGSLWFPGFTDWLREHPLHAEAVYLSLGDKEPLTKNPLMASVGTCTEAVYTMLGAYTDACFEWNEGNHFMNAPERLAKGIRWTVEHLQ
ncbi:MAG: hypothetical protein IKF51_06645 [Solobacterium sp.]|nr:hypothetical protein [Solobacterium sp.]